MVARIAVALLLLPLAANAQTADETHATVRKSLVFLDATATPTTGPAATHEGGARSQGTGFFVSRDGYLLTTRHLFAPLEAVEAVNTVIRGSVGDTDTADFPVQFVSDLPGLDLVLLKAKVPSDRDPPVPLRLGSSLSVDLETPGKFLTSGFATPGYDKAEAPLIEPWDRSVPHVWTLDVKIDFGQSGSPVYLPDATVIGIVKATAVQDDERTLMIPIDLATPLVGHLRIQELSDEVDRLSRIIGDITGDQPPIHTRLVSIEDEIRELDNQFEWSADVESVTGSLLISSEKLIGGQTAVDQIDVKIIPYLWKIAETTNAGEPEVSRVEKAGPLRLGDRSVRTGTFRFDVTAVGTSKRFREARVPGVQALLENLRSDSLVTGVRDLDVVISPLVNGELVAQSEGRLYTKTIKVAPTYDWKDSTD